MGRVTIPAIRQATPDDALRIIQLYNEIYEGNYPDPLMSEFVLLKRSLAGDDLCWIIAEDETSVVGSVVYRVDAVNRLAKVFGAVVRPAYRGVNLTEGLMNHGLAVLKRRTNPVEVVYATTRTLLEAPQKLTANLGYRKLGIFPNVHKTEEYETHCLAALFDEGALRRRYTDFALHPKIARIFEIARHECGLPPLPMAEAKTTAPAGATRASNATSAATTAPKPHTVDFETINAPKFVRHRFSDEKTMVQEHHWFFPFLDPNLLLTTPDQKIEVFAYFSEVDKHCALIGIRDVESVGYSTILASACKALHKLGARYIEFIMRADERQKIETALASQFIPCGYFPAMQLSAQGYRFDYVVFSRSYEILDFSNVRLAGVNSQYLIQYYENWKELSLDPILLRN